MISKLKQEIVVFKFTNQVRQKSLVLFVMLEGAEIIVGNKSIAITTSTETLRDTLKKDCWFSVLLQTAKDAGKNELYIY